MRSLEWHTNISLIKTINEKLPLFDIKIFKYTDPHSDLKYCIRQLVTSSELYAEGKYMHHCVYTYTKDCLAGKTYIFSLRQIDDKIQLPMVTIEVARSKLILQRKGAYNRVATTFENEVIAMWAKTNNLRLNC